MKPYIYVQVFDDGDDGVGLRHIAIEAADSDDAYAVGGRAMDGVPARGALLNDYVIALAPSLRVLP